MLQIDFRVYVFMRHTTRKETHELKKEGWKIFIFVYLQKKREKIKKNAHNTEQTYLFLENIGKCVFFLSHKFRISYTVASSPVYILEQNFHLKMSRLNYYYNNYSSESEHKNRRT